MSVVILNDVMFAVVVGDMQLFMLQKGPHVSTVCGLAYHQFVLTDQIVQPLIPTMNAEFKYCLLLPLIGSARVTASIHLDNVDCLVIASNLYGCVTADWKELLGNGTMDYPKTLTTWNA